MRAKVNLTLAVVSEGQRKKNGWCGVGDVAFRCLFPRSPVISGAGEVAGDQ